MCLGGGVAGSLQGGVMLRAWFAQSWVTVLAPTTLGDELTVNPSAHRPPSPTAIEPPSTTKKLEKCGFRSGPETYPRAISFKVCVRSHGSERLPLKEELMTEHAHQGGRVPPRPSSGGA